MTVSPSFSKEVNVIRKYAAIPLVALVSYVLIPLSSATEAPQAAPLFENTPTRIESRIPRAPDPSPNPEPKPPPQKPTCKADEVRCCWYLPSRRTEYCWCLPKEPGGCFM